MCLPVIIAVAVTAIAVGSLEREKGKRRRIAAEQLAETLRLENEAKLKAEAERIEELENPTSFTSPLAPGLTFTSAEARDAYLIEYGKEQAVVENNESDTEDNTGGTVTDDRVVVGYDEDGNPIYADTLVEKINTLEGEVETGKAEILSLEETIKELGDGDPEAVTKEIQNVTYTTIVQGIQEEQEQIKAKKAEQLRRTLRQRKRIGEKGRASLITGTSGGIGYSSGLIDQTKTTPSNITISKTVQ